MSASTALASLCRSLQVGDLPLHGGTHQGIINGAHNLCKAVESMKQDQVDQSVLSLLLSLLQRALKLSPCNITTLGGHPPLSPILPFITRVLVSSTTTASLTRKILGVLSCHPSLSDPAPFPPSSQSPSNDPSHQTPQDSLLRPLVASLASILHPAKAPRCEGDAAWGEARQEAHNRRRSLILLLKVAKLGGRETAHEALVSVRDGTRDQGGICSVASGGDDDLIAALNAALLLYAHLSQGSNNSNSSNNNNNNILRLRGQAAAAAAAECLTCVCSKGGQGGSSVEEEGGRLQCGPVGEKCWAHDMLNPVALLDGLCASLHGDHAVMFDLLISHDTRALAFLLSSLRRLEEHQQCNKRQRTG